MPDPTVLHVLEALEGGTARHLVDVVGHTPRYRHHAVIPAERVGGLTDQTAAERLRRAGATVTLVPMTRSPVTATNLRALARLVAMIRDLRPAIVHGHSSVGGALARAAAAMTRRACVYTPNGMARERAALAVERALGPFTARLVAVSPSEAAVVRARRIVPEHRIVTIPNAIETAPPAGGPDLRTCFGLDPAVPLVGSISRLVPQKAPERLARVLAEVLRRRPAVHAVVIGDGPERDAIVALASDPLLGARFHHLPELPRAAAVLGQLDVFVLVSRFEGGPYAPLEAMRAGRAVVLTDVVGNHDSVAHGVSGLLVPETDEAAMARAVLELLDDPDERARLGRAGRERVTHHFDIAAAGGRLADVYDEIRSGPPRAMRSGSTTKSD